MLGDNVMSGAIVFSSHSVFDEMAKPNDEKERTNEMTSR